MSADWRPTATGCLARRATDIELPRSDDVAAWRRDPGGRWVYAGGMRSGLLRSRVTPGHGVDEVVGSAVGASGGSGDVGFAVGAVVSDGGVLEDCSDGGA